MIASFYSVLCEYPWEDCIFLKGNGVSVDLEDRRNKKDLEERGNCGHDMLYETEKEKTCLKYSENQRRWMTTKSSAF